MDAKFQTKVINQGFIIYRSEDFPSPRIKYKDKEQHEWATLEKFETKAARDRRLKELTKNEFAIID